MPGSKNGSDSKKVVLAAIVGGILVTILKFLAAFATGSSAMLSEAIHSTVDTLNDSLLMLGLTCNKHAAKDHHPLGNGPFGAFEIGEQSLNQERSADRHA